MTYSRELRPRNAVSSNIPADTAMGEPAFRFGNPYFLEPSVDKLLWRAQIKSNLSIVSGNHTFKIGEASGSTPSTIRSFAAFSPAGISSAR